MKFNEHQVHREGLLSVPRDARSLSDLKYCSTTIWEWSEPIVVLFFLLLIETGIQINIKIKKHFPTITFSQKMYILDLNYCQLLCTTLVVLVLLVAASTSLCSTMYESEESSYHSDDNDCLFYMFLLSALAGLIIFGCIAFLPGTCKKTWNFSFILTHECSPPSLVFRIEQVFQTLPCCTRCRCTRPNDPCRPQQSGILCLLNRSKIDDLGSIGHCFVFVGRRHRMEQHRIHPPIVHGSSHTDCCSEVR